ncbi:CYFA0S16e01288g1_1 [Cyberlindnera fabianii]|uniref:CYFA0S16e01288g1_1 n=1 Tax=Cyberlindnera fabianii TaxID=36022 RepID=A0A061B5G9_CYBFA|nr:CYFA0S16e01288g1_1 [Cyberlindnera fabianii]
MTLPPTFYKSHAYPPPEKVTGPVNIVDIYLDYACPFSAKLFINWYENLYPKLTTEYENQVQFVFRNYIQPWHPTSNLLHEAALAVAQLQPDWFLEASYQLMKNITQFYDSETFGLTRHQIYDKVYDVCIGPNNSQITKEDFIEKLYIKKTDKPSNSGNAVTNDVKVFTRIGRQNGVHVTPTILINGYKDGSIESSTPIADIDVKLRALF